jgi:DNA-binding transcriptional MerR regulator
MDRHPPYSIGELARRTGTTVKNIRLYSDRGLIPPADRSPAGYRLYDNDSVARLNLVRTLRDLGLDLAAIRKVMDQELVLWEVAAAHADALDVQIRILRLRRAVLTAVAERGATPEEMDLMHKLATLSEAERRRFVDDFLTAVFDGVGSSPSFAGILRSLTPELPRDPNAKQVQAWVELAELSQDQDFRSYVRRLVEGEVAVAGGPVFRRDLAASVRDQVAPAVAADIDPASPLADPFVSDLMARCAHFLDGQDDAESRRQLLSRLTSMNDPRRERYLKLLAVINGWPAPESLQPVLDWSIEALRARGVSAVG